MSMQHLDHVPTNHIKYKDEPMLHLSPVKKINVEQILKIYAKLLSHLTSSFHTSYLS